ncbi:succinate dehydrogenase iron-sulfur subunit [Phycisphaerales bacterium AB-hyl4]|uniref:succinate dehydrogenase n=1 Tax=Natronomicrosphaera hydrolytica TaxID=3242702 RepID=A0ABV4U4S6_9BACT
MTAATTPTPSSKQKTFRVRIKRQESQGTDPHWHTFDVPYRPNLNIISVLQEIAARPVTAAGEQVRPPVWEANCLEEVCGACTMIINGHVRQSCSTLLDDVLGDDNTLTLEPMTKFPVVRDLAVDRQRMFNALKKIKAWVPIDGTHSLGAGPMESPEQQEMRYALSRCMTCGCCLEACPQYTKDNDFIGPAAIGQTLLFNLHETGKKAAGDRLNVMMEPGGITDCGNAQNCVKVCPKEVPLTEAIAHVGRQTTVHAVKKFFTGK